MAEQYILISGGLAAGGVETHVGALCELLRRRGADLTIAALSMNCRAASVEKLRQFGVKVLMPRSGSGSSALLSRMLTLLTWTHRLRPRFDAVYCVGHSRVHPFMRRFLRRGGYCLYHEIVTAPEPGHPMVRVAAGMDALVANSRAVARGMREAIPGVPVCTIPFMTASSPVDAPEPRPPIASRELRVVYLGRLVRHKRVDRLVRDWPRISTCIGPARLDIYGADFEGERMLAALRGFVREHRLEQQVCLHGAYDAHRDVARILQAADVVLLPSIFEGLPLTLIEAMQRGVPIVASAAGGTPELAENNPDVQVTGLGWDTFVAGLAAMAAALRRGEIDPMRLHRWTEARYGFETVADQWVQALLNPGEFWSQISLHPAS